MLTENERRRLLDLFGNHLPVWLLDFISKNDLPGKEFEISEEDDESGLGAEIEWMTPEDMIDEATKFYPGISAKAEGYIPIGTCQIGTGDPYFLKAGKDPADTALVRIPHEAISNEKLDLSQIEVVATSFGGLFGE